MFCEPNRSFSRFKTGFRTDSSDFVKNRFEPSKIKKSIPHTPSCSNFGSSRVVV